MSDTNPETTIRTDAIAGYTEEERREAGNLFLSIEAALDDQTPGLSDEVLTGTTVLVFVHDVLEKMLEQASTEEGE